MSRSAGAMNEGRRRSQRGHVPNREALQIRLKRAHDPPTKPEGERVLVARVWSQGVLKDLP
jgi:hypothetical protein